MFRSCFAPSTKESITLLTLSLWATSTGRVENVHEKAAADDLQFELLSRCRNIDVPEKDDLLDAQSSLWHLVQSDYRYIGNSERVNNPREERYQYTVVGSRFSINSV